jgi:hypothetical protein
MVELRKMRSDEFPGYVDYFVPDYATEISANYDVDIQTATKQAAQAVAESFEQGVETPGQVLLCIVAKTDDADTPIGYIWCQPNAKKSNRVHQRLFHSAALSGKRVCSSCIGSVE